MTPFDPFEPPRHGLTFNFANFFSPVRITRGTTLPPRRKGGSYSPESPLHFLSSRKRKDDPRHEGTRDRGAAACLENEGRKNNYSLAHREKNTRSPLRDDERERKKLG